MQKLDNNETRGKKQIYIQHCSSDATWNNNKAYRNVTSESYTCVCTKCKSSISYATNHQLDIRVGWNLRWANYSTSLPRNI